MGRKRKQQNEEEEDELLENSEEPGAAQQKASRYIDGDPDDPDSKREEESTLSGILEEPDLETVDEEEIEQSKQLDLAAMQRGQSSFEQDAFTDWVKMSQKYKPLSAAETRAWIGMAHGSDPELVEMAEDTLIRHNVLWIVQCLHRKAGSQIMSRSGETRNDLLSLGRWGMLTGIRKFSYEGAGKNNRGTEASLLTYSKFWIDKFAGEFLSREHFGLRSETALERNKAIKAREILRKELGREPTYEQIAQVMADKAKPGQTSRKRPGVDAGRIKDLLTHATSTTSIDAPVGDESGATIAEYVGDDSASELDRISQEERYNAVLEKVSLIKDPRKRMYFHLLHGIPGEHGFVTEVLTPQEVAVLAGKTREFVTKCDDEVRQEIWGEEPSRERPWVMSPPSVPGSIREDARKMVDLRRLVASEGLKIDARSAVARTDSPFASGAVLEVSATNWSCSSGKSGDMFDWLVERRGLTPPEALIEGLRLTVAIPGGRKTVTSDRTRSRKMEAHR